MRIFILLTVFMIASLSVQAQGVASIWYEGGTLQKANLAQWKGATPENQLATSADFIASLESIPDLSKVEKAGEMDRIKKRALDLQVCINGYAVSPDVTESMGVAEAVVLCTILKPHE